MPELSTPQVIEALKSALIALSGLMDVRKLDARRFAAIERGLLEAIGAETLLYPPQAVVIAPAHLQGDLTRLKYAGIAGAWTLINADQLIELGFATPFTYAEADQLILTARGRYSGTAKEIEGKQ